MTAETVKLARCRCDPSHVDPTECPEYAPPVDPAAALLALLRHVERLAQAWADVGEIPGATGEPADACDIATDVVRGWRDYLERGGATDPRLVAADAVTE